jgi:hypothetical protein
MLVIPYLVLGAIVVVKFLDWLIVGLGRQAPALDRLLARLLASAYHLQGGYSCRLRE